MLNSCLWMPLLCPFHPHSTVLTKHQGQRPCSAGASERFDARTCSELCFRMSPLTKGVITWSRPKETKVQTAGGRDDGADIKNIQERKRRVLVHGWGMEKKLDSYSRVTMVMGWLVHTAVQTLSSGPALRPAPLTELIHSS